MNAGSFDNPDFWAQYGTAEEYQERIGLVTGLLPDSVRSLIDVGCGKGEVINALQDRGLGNSISWAERERSYWAIGLFRRKPKSAESRGILS